MFSKFLEVIAAYAIKKRVEALRKTRLFSISFDETIDVERIGVIMVFIPFFDLNYNLVTE